MTYLGTQFTNKIGAMQVDEGITNEFRHTLDSRGMGPVRVVDRGESNRSTLHISLALCLMICHSPCTSSQSTACG
jgi:hypothetical protein